jgi:hypothetical protein
MAASAISSACIDQLSIVQRVNILAWVRQFVGPLTGIPGYPCLLGIVRYRRRHNQHRDRLWLKLQFLGHRMPSMSGVLEIIV